MSQSRKASVIEATTNTLVGYGIAVAGQYLIFPIFNIHVNGREHLIIGFCFLVISLMRSYLLRRIFNLFTERAT